MNFCNSCNKPKTTCNCPSLPSCEPKCGCGKPEPHHHIERKTDCCNTTSCKSSKQFDTKDVFYKINCGGYSDLDNLGIQKGASLESIIETFGRMLNSFNYFDVRDNIYEAKTFDEFMKALQVDLNDIKTDILMLMDNYEALKLDYQGLDTRISKLENPQILDTRGLGFTKFDTIFKVLQKLSDNGL